MSALLQLLRSGRKPVVGMVQLGALPGGSRYRGASVHEILTPALVEARILAENNVDALMVQNLGDIPVDARVRTVQATWMTRVVAEIAQRLGRPVGLNMLENDAEAMFAVATAAGADFVRIKIYVGAMVTPFGVETAQAFAAIKARTEWRADRVAILADVHDRTGVPLAPSSLEGDLDAAVRLGAADALVLTGRSYARTHEMIATARRVVGSTPILVGGGVAADNVSEVNAVSDGLIVSSSLKGSNSAFGQFDAAKVKAFMAAHRVTRAAA
jgi:membrane complex biogenesis BtpA family protein